jgi:hypothetical protein
MAGSVASGPAGRKFLSRCGMVAAMRSSLVALATLWLPAGLFGCGSSDPTAGPAPVSPIRPAAAGAAVAWSIPAGFRGETIPFPLEFAPGLGHRGAEELRFAPGFFDPAAPGYWSYAFAWRTEDAAALGAAALGGELTTYFRGLIAAVDDHGQIAARDREAIAVRATADGARFALAAHVIDAFKTKQPLELTGWAERQACGAGAVWRFVLAPATTGVRPQLDALAAAARCGQPLPPPPPAAPAPAPASR